MIVYGDLSIFAGHTAFMVILTFLSKRLLKHQDIDEAFHLWHSFLPLSFTLICCLISHCITIGVVNGVIAI
jgi:hypothetical protein